MATPANLRTLRDAWRTLLPCLLVLALLTGTGMADPASPAAQQSSDPPQDREPTYLRGTLRDPVDDSPLVGARVRVGPRVTRTGEDGSFEIRVGRRRTGNLPTRFEMPGYMTYHSWTVAGTDTTRTVYLFPDRPVRLIEHEDPIPPELLIEQFDLVYRDPIWTDPRQESGWIWRWKERPRIFVDSRVTESIEDEQGFRLVATRKVPGKVRRHVRKVISSVMGPLTGGTLEPGKIRFRRMREGEIVARDWAETYRRGEINVRFIDTGYFSSGGSSLIEAYRFTQTPTGGTALTLDLDGCRSSLSLSDCLTIVSGSVTLDLDSLVAEARRGDDYLVKHEFAHVLGMNHRMRSTHGRSGTPLCSIMNAPLTRMGSPCDDLDRTVGAVTHVDRVLARLAYSRSPGNDRRDRDPEPRD